MKVKNKAKLLICAIVFFFASICLAVVNVAAAETTSFEMQSVINEYYAFGTEFSVPSAEFVSGGNRYKAYTVVYDPDKEVITDKTFTLSKKGEYRISYSATIGDKQHREVYSFNSADLSANAFTVVNNAKITSGANTPDYYCLDSTGLKVTATADGGNVNYSKVIDLSGNTKKDNLLTLGVIPKEEGVEDLWQITITLTDIYDSTNKVRIVTYRGSWSKAYCFTRAAAKGQALAGYDHTKKILQTEYRMGTGATHSFTGANEAGFGSLSYAYDYAEKAVYVAGSLVVDFDSPDYFIESLLWDGFTTGEVTLNVSLEKLKVAEADIMIFNVNGNDLTKNVIDDKQAPIIDIDFGKYENQDLPNGEVGKAYTLFPAKAYDRSQGAMNQTDVVTTIYKNYNTPTQEVVANNVMQFTPTSAGEYYVQYECADVSGNTRYDGYTLVVESSIEAMKLVGYDLQESYYVGTEIIFPVVHIEGGSGIPAVKTFLRDKSGNVVLENPNTWLPKTAGEYELVVSAVDYLGNQFEQVFAFEMIIKDEPIIKVGYVPQYLIDGIAYTFSDFEAIDYSSSTLAQEAVKKVIVSYAGEETEFSVGDSYTPALKSGYDIITVRFYAESVNGAYSDYVEKEIRLVKAVNDGAVDYKKLFSGKDVALTVNESDISMAFSKNTEISYINPLVANDFSISFDVDKTKNNYRKIIITLTDSIYSDIAVSLSIERGEETATTSNLRVNNDERVYTIQGAFFNTTKNIFELSYSKTSHYLVDESGTVVICSLKETLNGDKFTGFPSGKIYVTLAFAGVTGESALTLYTISNQAFNNTGDDFSAPVLDLAEPISSQVGINDKVIVPQAYVADGVDPSAKVVASVYQGKKVLYANVDVSEQGFDFVVDTYKTYKIVYVTTDWKGNIFEGTYSVYVQDVERPNLKVEWNITTAKQGDTVTLPVATATDNNDAELNVEIYVYYPQGDCRIYKEQKLTFNQKGTYKIVVFVQDEAGNYARKTFEVVVS